jgi:hypothetical protein
MTTYATTYGWRSTGIRGDLMTSPTKHNPVNEGRRGPTGVYGIADPITTNQKVAGSSPAERATKIPAKRRETKALGGVAGAFGSSRPNCVSTVDRSLSCRRSFHT